MIENNQTKKVTLFLFKVGKYFFDSYFGNPTLFYTFVQPKNSFEYSLNKK